VRLAGLDRDGPWHPADGERGRGKVKLIAFPYHDWRKAEAWGFRNRDLHVLQELAHHPAIDDILVIDRPVSMIERVTTRGPWSVKGSVVTERSSHRRTGRVTRVGPRTAVLDIAVPDLIAPMVRRRAWWFDIFEDPMVLEMIDWATRVLDLTDARVIAWTPTVGPAVQRIRPGSFVFDSLDNWISHPILRRNEAEARIGYATLLPNATAVVAPSPASRAVLQEWASNVVVIPNGVDVERFQSRHPRPADLPAGPIVGYSGTIGVRTDPALIRAVADRLPDVSFVFVGPVRERSAIKEILGRPNVVLLGERHYDALPSYLQHFDVGWIPHRVGQGETGGDPIKTYEYWAAGLQVVSTRLDGFDRWADQLHLIDSPADGARIIRGLLDATIAPRRTDVPPERTWTAIAAEIFGLLDTSPEPATS
jgi:glycosyltransferase involved in cell wall biosynthesis